MRYLLTIALGIVLMMGMGCDSSSPVEPWDMEDMSKWEEGITAEEVGDRSAEVSLPIDQCREWLAWWFADNYSDLLGNSRYDKDFMMCYLYRYAIFRDGLSYYFGSYELFVESDVFNDFQIYAFVAALEDSGIVPFYPIEPPC